MRRPSFLGIIRGEAIKVSRQLSFWLMLAGGLLLRRTWQSVATQWKRVLLATTRGDAS